MFKGIVLSWGLVINTYLSYLLTYLGYLPTYPYGKTAKLAAKLLSWKKGWQVKTK
jgi:hypothetical protein